MLGSTPRSTSSLLLCPKSHHIQTVQSTVVGWIDRQMLAELRRESWGCRFGSWQNDNNSGNHVMEWFAQ
jgi:hypothetical protein